MAGPPRKVDTGSPRGLDGRFPRLAAVLPRQRLADLPSALEPAPTLGAALGIPDLLRKRDDACAPVYGGNKVRKLEYLLGDALARGCDSVVTFGAAGSNHALATAIYARALGLPCHAILTDQVHTAYVADTLRWHALLGTRLIPAAGLADADAKAAALRAGLEAAQTGDAVRPLYEIPYEIPWGGSSWLGTVGFVAAGLELADQLAAEGHPPPECIYLPCGTMGSVAGLLLGLRAAGLSCTVVAVKVVPQKSTDAAAIGRLCAETNAELRRCDPDFPVLGDPLAGLEFRAEFLGAGYADVTDGSRAAVRLAAEHGVPLDTTYSGKAMACLIADARERRIRGPVLFWQTYNSRPYPPGIVSVDARQLPPAFRKFLRQGN